MADHVPQDVTTHLMNHLSLHLTLRTCSSDTILRAIKELTQENISYTSDMGKTYDFNTADTLNTLLLNCIFASGQLKGSEMYDVDFDHQIIEIEKYDAKPTYKKFFGYRPGVSVIDDLIVGIENSNGNTNVRFHQKNTQKRFFERFEQNGLIINRFRTDCGACSKEIVEEIEKHSKSFYIRANRCSSIYNDTFALKGWKTEEINGIEFELNSILVEKWKGKAYRLVFKDRNGWMVCRILGNNTAYCLKSHCGVRGYCRQKWVFQIQIICKFSNERMCKCNKDVERLSCGFEVL